MSLAECIASAACGLVAHNEGASVEKMPVDSFPGSHSSSDGADLLEGLRFIVESSKQHFNPNYRLRGL